MTDAESKGPTHRDPDGQTGFDRAARAALSHPLRAALLDLIRRRGTITATEAARELGGNTGQHSFHLRQLARYGFIEEAPHGPGRVRPWRLVGPVAEPEPEEEMACLARGLEDEVYRNWLAQRDQAPQRWRHDEAFSQILYLTPRELTEVGSAIRDLINGYRHRENRPLTRPPGSAPVAVVARLFPLLEPDSVEPGGDRPDETGPQR
ncbi:helix-turn-helix transcriptional regulator [Micromonospora sp. C31]|uniref:winged helix-turn-helix domain-containing protein n=1 Tax=Micromonospora sp. C31 TaxID=2824876 RepID=UPI001B35CB50|nr:helix-turn-helix domain-containing protein [Micromonospora sp. C31]MBQ1075641.1 helix-turn-helix transcriptional regulator [Micromonospora sp. C31]